MRIVISNDIDKRTLAARMMTAVQSLLMGDKIELEIAPDVSMKELSEMFDKFSELTDLASRVIGGGPVDPNHDDADNWKN